MNRLGKLTTRAAFVSLTAVALTTWPFGCASNLSSKTNDGSQAGSAEPGQLARAEGALANILPHPAFAHAKSVDGAVTVADIAERAAPSVVNVASSKMIKAAPPNLPFLDDPFFRRFFGPGVPGGPGGPGGPHGSSPHGMPEREQRGMGSGVIVSKDGIVLTNNHVVDGAEEIQVTTADEREFTAEVVGTDEKSDLAVLRLEGDTTGLTPIEFADSSRVRLGDVVLAIGNPFGVGQTITMGIVSAKGRANVGIVDYEDFIQTDAAINPGNSGGALVDMEGRLLGINTAILSRSGGYMGIGFAIPSNMAAPIMKSLLEDGKVTRGWLGVGIQDVDGELAEAMGLSTTKGVLVSDVMSDSPASRAGLERGDVIVSVEGKPTASTGRLRNAIAAFGAGRKVRVELIRNGKSLTKTVELGELTERAPVADANTGTSGSAPTTLGGMQLAPLSPAARKRFGIPGEVSSGLVVTNVQRSSPAAKAGLRPGDVIVEVDRKPLKSVGQFRRAYQGDDDVLLLVARGGHTTYRVMKSPK